MRPVRVVFESEIDKAYKELVRIVAEEKSKGIANSDNQRLLKSINYSVENLKRDRQFGDPIPKNLFPKKYVLKHGINNLWDIDLVNHWRMIYTIKGDRIEIVCLILDYISHPDYDKLFGYRKK
ncbi:MAG: hypothetical protein NTY73_03020 [Candidatus Micrarchaeota archaeon]|nr:hypothetical protein [Candidatus Micrarchaeota archaeon]